MRIIHTSDWHLGQYFFTKSRAAEHHAFLAWLIERIEQYQVDALIVAGDIFDNGSPPSYARELYNRFVVELQNTGCQLIIMAGNHDSVAMLNESKQLLSCLNTQVITALSAQPDEQIVMIKDRQQQPLAIFCAIPFLRSRDLLFSRSGQSAQEKQHDLQQAITDHYQQLYQQAVQLRQQLNLPLPIIASGHLTTVGASSSESEREIYIGTLAAYPAQAFPPFDYLALGHIHRAQKIAGLNHIRYSGSPIPLSFDELGAPKSVYLVEFEKGNLAEVTALEIPEFRPMQLIKGDLAAIKQQLKSLTTSQKDQPVWLSIEVASQGYLADLQQQIQQMTADLPVEVILLRRSKEQRQTMLTSQDKETLAELTTDEVFWRRLSLEQPPIEAEQQQRLTQLFQQVVTEVETERQRALAQLQARQAVIEGNE